MASFEKINGKREHSQHKDGQVERQHGGAEEVRERCDRHKHHADRQQHHGAGQIDPEHDRVEPGDVPALARALGHLIEEPSAIIGLGRRGRDLWEGCYQPRVHGATMASGEFTKESEKQRPTVQVGDPFMEKLLMEACLEVMKTGAGAAMIKDPDLAVAIARAAHEGSGLPVTVKLRYRDPDSGREKSLVKALQSPFDRSVSE